MKTLRIALLASLATVAVSAQATIFLFCGQDAVNFTNDPRPVSNAAFAQWAVIAGSNASISFATFENQAINAQNGLMGPGMNVSSTNNSASHGVLDTDDVILGFNTTPGGRKHYRLDSEDNTNAVVMTFNFADPINSFGAWFTGVGTAAGIAEIEWTNSVGVQKIVLGELSGGSVQFCGFVDLNESFTQVRVQLLPESGGILDEFGVDDVGYSNCNPVPEPASISAIVIGLAALARRKRRA